MSRVVKTLKVARHKLDESLPSRLFDYSLHLDDYMRSHAPVFSSISAWGHVYTLIATAKIP